METLKLKNINLKGGYRIELSVNPQGKPVGKSLRLLTSGKNKGHYKQMENFYFQSEERRNEWIKQVIEKVVSREQQKANEIAKKAEVRNNMEHPYKVGQVLYASWGYGQTNVDFYQIIEIKGKQLILKTIAGDLFKYNSGDSGRIRPIVDSFEGEAKKKNIQFYLDSKGNPQFYVRMDSVRSLSIYDSGEDGVHCSWGH